jgi:DNA-binding NarL/FixJ family response regulator
LGLIWQGLTNRQIGEKLEISIKTVEAHRATMMKRFRASNTAELLRTGIENGLLKLPEG